MINAINVPIQEIEVNQNIPFAQNKLITGCSAVHEEGSSSFILLKSGIYKVTFNTYLLTTADSVATLNLTANGDTIPSAQARITTAANNYYNFTITTLVRVFGNNSVRVAVVNNSLTPVSVGNSNMIIERLC